MAEKFDFPRKAFLLNEGDICKQIFFIEQGCVRSWFNDDGRDITFQFFFEGNFVSSFESLKNNEPCLYNIETITSATLYVIHRDDFFRVVNQSPELMEIVNNYILKRFYHYQKLFISRITHSPQLRYEELVNKNPEILERVPQHYIATYLGITPVSFEGQS
ncbi:MAG: Crp/Fnr family transcriptional regulator [Chloroflexota bacterium]